MNNYSPNMQQAHPGSVANKPIVGKSRHLAQSQANSLQYSQKVTPTMNLPQ